MSQAWLTPPNTDGMASMAFFLNDRVTRKKHEACPALHLCGWPVSCLANLTVTAFQVLNTFKYSEKKI